MEPGGCLSDLLNPKLNTDFFVPTTGANNNWHSQIWFCYKTMKEYTADTWEKIQYVSKEFWNRNSKTWVT